MYMLCAFLMSPSEAVFSTPSTFKQQMPKSDAGQARPLGKGKSILPEQSVNEAIPSLRLLSLSLESPDNQRCA